MSPATRYPLPATRYASPVTRGKVLPRERCREKIEIALSKIAKLPWVNWYRREQIEIAVNKLKLPWSNLNYRE